MFSINKSTLIPVDTPILFVIVFIFLTFSLGAICIKKFKGYRKSIFKFWCLSWLILTIILFSTGGFGRFVEVSTINTKGYRAKELTEDLEQLEKCIIKENPLYFADKDELKQLFALAYGEIKDGMTELEFYRLVNPIIVAVRCGHTNLSISEALVKNRVKTAAFFPLKVTLVDDELYMLEDLW